jgi:hypothetical protein
MRFLATTTAISGVLFASHVFALDAVEERQLEALDPVERQEQRCDIEAMDKIAIANKAFDPDKVIAYTFADPIAYHGLLKAPGAVFRSKGDWYRLKYRCETDARGVTVLSFDYKIGSKVDRSDWTRYYLYK